MSGTTAFDEELRAARADAGLSQRELAAMTGLPQPRISEYERGVRVPDVDRAAALLAAAGRRLQVVPDGLSPEDQQLLALTRALTPEQRLVQSVRLAQLRGTAA